MFPFCLWLPSRDCRKGAVWAVFMAGRRLPRMAPGCLGTLETRAASGVWPPFSLAARVDLASAAASARAAQRGSSSPSPQPPSHQEGPDRVQQKKTDVVCPQEPGRGAVCPELPEAMWWECQGSWKGYSLSKCFVNSKFSFSLRDYYWGGQQKKCSAVNWEHEFCKARSLGWVGGLPR